MSASTPRNLMAALSYALRIYTDSQILVSHILNHNRLNWELKKNWVVQIGKLTVQHREQCRNHLERHPKTNPFRKSQDLKVKQTGVTSTKNGVFIYDSLPQITFPLIIEGEKRRRKKKKTNPDKLAFHSP